MRRLPPGQLKFISSTFIEKAFYWSLKGSKSCQDFPGLTVKNDSYPQPSTSIHLQAEVFISNGFQWCALFERAQTLEGVLIKMKKLSGAFQLAVMACVLLFCCAASALAQDVHYNFAVGTDFSKYKTYKWVLVPDVTYPNQLLDGQIKQAIDSQLSMKGLTKTEDDAADLYVAYQFAVNQQTEWNAYGTGGGMGYGRWGRLGMGMGTATATSTTINIGTLVLDFYDVAAKSQVWRGDATKTLNPSKDPQKNQKKLQKAMAKLLKNFPPQAR